MIVEGFLMNEKISIITPVYNERSTLKENVFRLQKSLTGFNFEIIIVDDNSPDGSGKIADRLVNHFSNIKVLHRDKKMGLGTAYKDGFFLTDGELIISMDSDLSHDPIYLPQMISAIGESDIVIGSRFTSNGKIIGRTIIRDLLSESTNFFIRVITRNKIKDWTSGLRVYKRNVWELLMPKVHCDKWDFQFESLYKAITLGYNVSEVPIKFYERARGNSKFSFKEALQFLLSFINIILNIKRF